MGEPFSADGVQVALTEALPGVTEGAAGAVGAEAGVTGAEAGDIVVPIALVAETVKVYAVPLSKPLTVHEVVVVVQDLFPGEAITLYEVMGEPLAAGAVHETLAEPLAGTAVGAAGVAGGPVGAAAADAVEGAEAPALLSAVARKL